jgi:hypothetical protein
MRWFKDEAYADDDTDWPRVLSAYAAHLAEIAPRLPANLVDLATDPRMDLHDGRFRKVQVDRTARAVALVIDCGNLQVGYRRLHLRFDAANVVPDNSQLLAEAIGAEFRANHWHQRRSVTEIRAVEVDLLPGDRFALRLRLWPFYEFAVEFSALSIRESPLAGRGPARAGRFV